MAKTHYTTHLNYPATRTNLYGALSRIVDHLASKEVQPIQCL